MLVLTLNAGSRSRQAVLYDVAGDASLDEPEARWRASVEASDDTFGDLLAGYDGEPPAVVAHRVVHPGVALADRLAVRVDDAVVRSIESAIPLAREHDPLALEGIAASRERFGGEPLDVAVSDVALAVDPPAFATTCAVAPEWTERFALRRYGYHGISQRDVIARVERAYGPDARRRTVSLHLGNGASLSGFVGDRLVETTMGLTPLEGVVMGQRSGSVDPGLVLYLARECGLSAEAIEDGLYHRSGLLGLSGVSADTREIEAAIGRGDERARRALDYYAYRVRWHVGALAACIGGIDVLAFTGPVGEHSVTVRRLVCDGLEFLGVELDVAANGASRPGSSIEVAGAPARIAIVPTLEAWAMARIAARLARSEGRPA